MLDFLFSSCIPRQAKLSLTVSIPISVPPKETTLNRKTIPSNGPTMKRRSEKIDYMATKKTRRLTNSGFLDRAFENAWYLPELDDDLDDDMPFETSVRTAKSHVDENGFY